MAFHKIDLNSWPRRTHYEAYHTALPLCWNVTVRLDISRLLPALRARELRLYPALLYLASRAVQQNRAFCMGYDASGALGYYDEVHPSYTVFHKDDETFSDIWSTYHADFAQFYAGAVHDMSTYGDVHGYKARPNAPENCCPMSMTPWLDFTSCSFDTYRPSPMLRPVLTFGKFSEHAGKITLPLAICASHSVADGWHAACLVRDMQALADAPEVLLGENW